MESDKLFNLWKNNQLGFNNLVLVIIKQLNGLKCIIALRKEAQSTYEWLLNQIVLKRINNSNNKVFASIFFVQTFSVHPQFLPQWIQDNMTDA